jgi:tetratricopeptide (TPR) repeat protein
MEGLHPELLKFQAREVYKAGNYREAAQLFLKAREEALLLVDHLFAAEMANEASVSYLMAGDPRSALGALDGVYDTFHDLGKIQHMAVTLGNQASAAEKLRNIKQAENNYRQAGKLFKEIGEGELYSHTMQSLSFLYLRTLKPKRALLAMNEALVFKTKLSLTDRILKCVLRILWESIIPR